MESNAVSELVPCPEVVRTLVERIWPTSRCFPLTLVDTPSAGGEFTPLFFLIQDITFLLS